MAGRGWRNPGGQCMQGMPGGSGVPLMFIVVVWGLFVGLRRGWGLDAGYFLYYVGSGAVGDFYYYFLAYAAV